MGTGALIIVLHGLVATSIFFVLATAVLSSLEIAFARRRAQLLPEGTVVNNPTTTPPNPGGQEAELRNRLAKRQREVVAARSEATRLSLELRLLSELARQQASTIASLSEARTACTDQMDGGRFRRLRALVLKELHPDSAPSSSIERAVRAEIFKVIWPKLEAIRDGV